MGEPIAIGALEKFIGDYKLARGTKVEPIKKIGRRVAVVGSGPAGLTCAADLAREGFEVTIFEAFQRPGGVLTYGIPEFRLPKRVVQNEIKMLKELGVVIKCNVVVGKLYCLMSF